MIIYKGRSNIDGKNIVVIATGLDKSANAKTGNMVQTWVLVDNGIKPHENVKSGADITTCGDCKHRPSLGGACYVKTFQGPRSVYDKYLRGGYEEPTAEEVAEILAGKLVRLGAYGEPSAVPFEVWEKVLSKVSGWTGYTHQWQSAGFDERIMRFCMASVDSEGEAAAAKLKGFRYFRVKTSTSAKLPKEVTCPASEEAGKKTNCAACTACRGTNGLKSNIVIDAHGATKKRFIEIKAA
jgi:hypothetical protein